MMKNRHLLLTATIALLSLATSASQGDRYYQEVQGAKNSINQSLNSSAFNSFNEESYCSDATCVAEMNNPSQKDYFGNDNKMADDGMIGLANDPNAANVVTGFNDRPKYDIDPNDPALRRAKGYMDDSYNISHGISSKYHDCDDGSVCLFDPIKTNCSQPTNNNVPCYSDPVATIELGTTRYQCPSGWGLSGTTCSASVRECRYDIRNRVLEWDDGVNSGSLWRWDNRNAHPPTYSKGRRMYSSWDSDEYQICKYVPKQQPATLTCDAGYTLSGAQCLRNSIQWKTPCDLLSGCNQVGGRVCIDGAGTRTVNGIPTYLPCWKYQINNKCDLPNTCDALLSPTKIKSTTQLFTTKTAPNIVECAESKRVCSQELLGVCIAYDVTLDCQEKQCEQIGLICGEESFCLDGDCYNPPPQINENFDESAAALAALGAAAANLNADSLTIFSGEPAFCSKKPIGLSDCCADSGWGGDIGLTQCSEEEKALADAKEDGLTVSLGEYCAEEVLGVCIRKKKSYCLFDSKMSRIVQEQGRPQIGLDFGSKKKPECDGITPEQLSQLDFSTIDFSDFYEDMQGNMELPDMDLIQDSISDKFEDMQK